MTISKIREKKRSFFEKIKICENKFLEIYCTDFDKNWKSNSEFPGGSTGPIFIKIGAVDFKIF